MPKTSLPYSVTDSTLKVDDVLKEGSTLPTPAVELNLDELDNVDVTNPSENHTLFYDSSLKRWVNKVVTGLSGISTEKFLFAKGFVLDLPADNSYVQLARSSDGLALSYEKIIVNSAIGDVPNVKAQHDNGGVWGSILWMPK